MTTSQQSPVKETSNSMNKLLIVIAIFLVILILSVISFIIYLLNVKSGTNESDIPTPLPTVTTEVITPTVNATPEVTQTATPSLTPTVSPTIKPTSTHKIIPTPTPQFAVTAINVIPDYYCQQTDGAGGYPFSLTFFFTGTITVNGPGTVTYKWQPTPPSITTTQTLTFTSAGSKTVSTSTIGLTILNWQTDYVYGLNYIKVFTPNSISSNVVNVTLDNNRNNVHPCPVH